VLEHRIEHPMSNVPEFQLASEQAPCLLLGEIQRRFVLALWKNNEGLLTYQLYWTEPIMIIGSHE